MDRFDWIEFPEGSEAIFSTPGLREEPTDGPSFYRAARAMREAFEMSDISLDGRKRRWFALCVRAEILLKVSPNNQSDALDLLEEALEAGRSLWEPHFLGGCILLETGWPVYAAGYFSEAAHRKPRAPAAWICLGDCFRDLRLYDQAVFYYEKAIELEPRHELALERLRTCKPAMYGLTRMFKKETLRDRWNRAMKEQTTREPNIDDF